jgi:diadenosine tetraphosphate (Ap4A) HIT family hydrolase
MIDDPLSSDSSPFVDILNGNEPGNIIVKDVIKRFAIVESLHPEAAVHWLAIPYEPITSIEKLEQNNPERFSDLVDFAVTEAKARVKDYPELTQGFTIKFHFGTFETIPHAKLHILSCE